MKVGDRVDSDHQPLEVEMKGVNKKIIEEKKGEEKVIVKWDNDNVEDYQRRVANVQIEGKSVEEQWKEMKKGVEESKVRKKIKLKRKKIGEYDWWDQECRRKKRQLRKPYLRWRGGREEKDSYLLLRKELRNLKKKKERWTEKIEEEIRSI